MVIDVWMQHPTLRFLSHEMFASLRRWTGAEIPQQAPGIEATLDAMDAARVDLGCCRPGLRPTSQVPPH